MSSRIPVSPRYFENPEGRAPVTLLFCEVRKLASPEASRPRSRCSWPRNTQNDRPKKAHQAFRAACVGTCVLCDGAGQSGQCLATKKRSEDAATLVDQRLLTGFADDAGQTCQHSGLLLPHDLGQFGCALWFRNIRNKGSKKCRNGCNNCFLGRCLVQPERGSNARHHAGGQELRRFLKRGWSPREILLAIEQSPRPQITTSQCSPKAWFDDLARTRLRQHRFIETVCVERIPIARAAPSERSKLTPRVNGPRSLTVTLTLLPVLGLLTRRHVPKGKLL